MSAELVQLLKRNRLAQQHVHYSLKGHLQYRLYLLVTGWKRRKKRIFRRVLTAVFKQYALKNESDI